MRLTSKNGWRSPLDSDMINAIYNKLAAYEDAEEQGLLVRLPCKVGDTLYIPDKDAKTVREVSVRCIIIENDDVFIECKFDCSAWDCPCALGSFRWGVEECDCENCNYYVFTISDFGKTVFLHREEAEAAPKGEGNE